MRAGGAHSALVFYLPVRTGAALYAAVFPLAVRAGVAHHAHVFPLAVGAGVARRAAGFLLAVRAGVALRTVLFSLLCEHRFFPILRAPRNRTRTRFCGHRKRRGRSRGFFFVLSQYRIIGSAKIQLAVLWPPIVVQHPSPHNSSRVHAEKAHLWRFKRTPYGRLQRLRGRGANQLVHDARVKEERLDTSTFGQSSVPTPADVGTDARSTV